MTHRHAPITDLAAARILVTDDDGIPAPGIKVPEGMACSDGRKQGLALEKRTDPDGRPSCRLMDRSKEEEEPRGSDLAAINDAAIAITPISIDFTARGFLGDLREAFG